MTKFKHGDRVTCEIEGDPITADQISSLQFLEALGAMGVYIREGYGGAQELINKK